MWTFCSYRTLFLVAVDKDREFESYVLRGNLAYHVSFFPSKINALTSLFWVSRASNIWSQSFTLLVTESLKPTGEVLVVSLPAELEHLEGLWPLEVAHRPGCRLRYRVVGHPIGLKGSYKTLRRHNKTFMCQKNASALAIFINIYSSLGLSSLIENKILNGGHRCKKWKVAGIEPRTSQL